MLYFLIILPINGDVKAVLRATIVKTIENYITENPKVSVTGVKNIEYDRNIMAKGMTKIKNAPTITILS